MEIHLTSVNSTNTWVKDNYKELDAQAITRVTASEQTKGRGRFNREWVSPKDQNIYVTYFFSVPKEIINLNSLAQLLCLSIAKLLAEHEMDPHIKWPNDLIVNSKKIGGILCETIDFGKEYGIIIGAGLNVNMPPDMLEKIDQPATSFFNELGKTFTLDPLIKQLDHFFLQDLSLYKREGFKPFYMSYEALLTHKGMPITLKQNGDSISGVLHSLNPDGRLNLLLPNGKIKTISSGEIKK